MLLARDPERQRIGEVPALARSGTSALLALAGEPGIGKTALLQHAPRLRPECRSRVLARAQLRAAAERSSGSVPSRGLTVRALRWPATNQGKTRHSSGRMR